MKLIWLKQLQMQTCSGMIIIMVDKNVDDHDVDADDVLPRRDHHDGWKC